MVIDSTKNKWCVAAYLEYFVHFEALKIWRHLWGNFETDFLLLLLFAETKLLVMKSIFV